MAEKDKIFESKIKQVGFANFKDYYSFMYDWLNGEEYDVSEDKYSETIEGDATKIEIEWTAFRKISDYFKFELKIAWKVLNMKTVEVERDGKKVKIQSGTFELKVKGYLVKDYENKWEDRPFWKFLRGVYDRYIIRTRIIQYEDKLFGECDNFLAQAKSFLAIEGKR